MVVGDACAAVELVIAALPWQVGHEHVAGVEADVGAKDGRWVVVEDVQHAGK
jgi:hypothetical protein